MRPQHPLKRVGQDSIETLLSQSATGTRGRAALPIHVENSDPVQRVLMAAEPDTYVGPHRHPGKPWELLVLLEGAMDVLVFSEDGVLEERTSLRQGDARAIEYPADRYHAAVIHEPGTLVLEVKPGPYDPATAKDLPNWAPEENAPGAEKVRELLRALAPGQRLFHP